MSFGTFNLVFIGLLASSAVFFILIVLVSQELGPAAKLVGKTKLLLVLALGAGVGAFTVKLGLIAGVSSTLIPLPQYSFEKAHTNQSSNANYPAKYRLVKLSKVRTFDFKQTTRGAEKYKWEPLPEIAPSPSSNPSTPQKIQLGKRLFNDPLLSYDQTISCASCHELYESSGADKNTTAIGIAEKKGLRNTPTVWNAAFQSVLFWDGRASSLEEQVKGPILNEHEMGMPSFSEVEHRIQRDRSYREGFRAAFGEVPITIDRIAEAIAAYERTLITPDTPYDHFIQGDMQALSDQQIRGMALFEKAGCVTCHYGPNFSSASIFDSSAPFRIFPVFPTPYDKSIDLFERNTGYQNNERRVWRVPSLRNVALTGPWLHNGSVSNLQEVVKIMASAQLNWSGHYLVYSDRTRQVQETDRPVLTDQQVDDIVKFLHALSSDYLLNKKNDKLLTRALE